MRLLLDENLDWRVGRDLPEHQVESVPLIGWAGIENGELLSKAVEAGFDALVTMDSNMVHQQNIGRHAIAVVALRAPSNRLADTRPLMPALLALRCYASMIFRKASVENTRGVTRGEATSSYWSPTLQKCFRMVKQ